MDGKNPNTTANAKKKPEFAHRPSTSTPRCMRFPDAVWEKLAQDAKREDLSIAELLRRIVDLYYARAIKESQASERFLNIEARLAKVETTLSSIARGLPAPTPKAD